MTATKTKTITFEEIMKNFKNFVASRDTRPVLTLVHFDGKYLVATDSHRLMRVNAAYISDMPKDEPFFYNPKTKEFVDYDKFNYPQTDRLIPNSFNAEVIINDNLKTLDKEVKEAKKVLTGVKNKPVTFNFVNDHTLINAHNPKAEAYNSKLDNVWVDGEYIRISMNAMYLTQAFTAIKKLRKLSHDSVKLGLVSEMRPALFTQSDIFDIVVLPIRIV